MTETIGQNAPFRSTAAQRSFRGHLKETFRLGLPVTVARAGVLGIVMADTAMTGHFGSTDLAFYALAHATAMVMLLGGVGMMVGTAVLTAQARGAGLERECGVVWRVASLHAALLGLLFVAICGFGEPILLLLGQRPDLAEGGGRSLWLLGLGLPGQLVFVASSLFLEALGRPRVGLWLMIAANLANIVLNWFLIFGHAGLPALGAEGAALATTLVRCGLAVAVVLYILRCVDDARFNVRGALRDGWAIGRKFRRIGYPLGLAQGLESMAFASLTVLAGFVGPQSVGAFQIVINCVALCYMSAVGIGTAAAVRVGEAVGRGSRTDTAQAGWAGLAAICIVMAGLAVVMALLPGPIAAAFTADAGLRALVVPTLLFAAITLVPDGAQGVIMGALRGTGDVWVPTAMHLCSFIFVMIPAAALFALVLDFGAPGLMAGALAGTTVATVLLGLRFRVISRSAIKRL